jgi:hypothetical protein
MMKREVSSKNSTFTCVHCPWEPVRPSTFTTCENKASFRSSLECLIQDDMVEWWTQRGRMGESESKKWTPEPQYLLLQVWSYPWRIVRPSAEESAPVQLVQEWLVEAKNFTQCELSSWPKTIVPV